MFDDIVLSFENHLKATFDSRKGEEQHLLGLGKVAAFEQKLSTFYEMPYCISFNSATNALFMVVYALGLKYKEILTTPFCYGASISPFLFFENKISIVDIQDECHTPNFDLLKEKVNQETAAFLGVDYCGIPQDMFAIRSFCDDNNLLYIADAAQSLGATIKGKPASSLADILLVSFTVGKTICCGEGGAILLKDKELYELILWYSQHPKRQKMELGLHCFNEFNVINGRINPFAAMIGADLFEAFLSKAQSKSKQCLELLDYLILNDVINKYSFKEKEVIPTFYYLTAKAKFNRKELEVVLSNTTALCRSLPYDLINNNPILQHLYPNQVKTSQLLYAQEHLKNRYELLI